MQRLLERGAYPNLSVNGESFIRGRYLFETRCLLEKMRYIYVASPCLLELLATEYLREIINFHFSLMSIRSLAALKVSSKKKEMAIEKEIVAVLKHASDHRKKTGK